MKTNKGGISKYCEEFNTKMVYLAALTGISFSQLYLIDKNPLYPVKIITLQKIYEKTKKRYGKGLRPQDFLDFDILHRK